MIVRIGESDRIFRSKVKNGVVWLHFGSIFRMGSNMIFRSIVQ